VTDVLRRIPTFLAALGIATIAPGTASAEIDPYFDPNRFCTDTAAFSWSDFDVSQGGLVLEGTSHADYVNSAPGMGNESYRVWHVTYDPVGLALLRYERAFAARCSVGHTYLSEVHLTKQPPVLPAGDPKCGIADFTIGSTYYDYLGGRASSGDTFRYWATTLTKPSGLLRGVASARCN
jgi:hypothetical protein